MQSQLDAPSTATTSIEQWLQHYDQHSSVFVSPFCSLMGQGTAFAQQAQGDPSSLKETVQGLFRQATQAQISSPIVMGAIPFNPSKTSFFRVPQHYQLGGPLLRPQTAPAIVPGDHSLLGHTLSPSGAEYEHIVQSALDHMQTSEITKLVMARQLHLQLAQPLDRKPVLQNMLQSNPGGYTYALPLQDSTHPDPATFLGASPELLIKRQGDQIFVNPLAGTCARDSRPEHDQALAQQLLRSEKDRREHALVIDDVVRILAPYCSELDIPEGPSLVSTRNLWHLSTRISGRLCEPDTDALELALAMHPTPAVCGTPTSLAMQTIETLEPFERGLFAGAVGWMDAAGNGEWAVAIRCAHYQEQQLCLSAGAGIVPGSEPALERLETGNKLMSLLGLLGLSQAIDTL